MIKTLKRISIGTYFNLIIVIYIKPVSSIILWAKMKAFSLKSELRREYGLRPLLSTTVFETWGRTISQEKEIKGYV